MAPEKDDLDEDNKKIFEKQFVKRKIDPKQGSSKNTARNEEQIETTKSPRQQTTTNQEQTSNSPEPTEISNNLTVFEDENVSFVLNKYKRKNIHRFSAEEQMFELKVIPKNKKSPKPLFESLLEGLSKSLDNVLNILKEHFDLKHHFMVYISILGESITGSIHSGKIIRLFFFMLIIGFI